MADAAVTLMKITIKSTFLFGAVMAFIVIFNVMITGLLVGLNMGVLTDIFAIVQMWMPFNLGTLLMWLTSTGLLFLGYRALMVGFDFLRKVLDD